MLVGDASCGSAAELLPTHAHFTHLLDAWYVVGVQALQGGLQTLVVVASSLGGSLAPTAGTSSLGLRSVSRGAVRHTPSGEPLHSALTAPPLAISLAL